MLCNIAQSVLRKKPLRNVGCNRGQLSEADKRREGSLKARDPLPNYRTTIIALFIRLRQPFVCVKVYQVRGQFFFSH